MVPAAAAVMAIKHLERSDIMQNSQHHSALGTEYACPQTESASWVVLTWLFCHSSAQRIPLCTKNSTLQLCSGMFAHCSACSVVILRGASQACSPASSIRAPIMHCKLHEHLHGRHGTWSGCHCAAQPKLLYSCAQLSPYWQPGLICSQENVHNICNIRRAIFFAACR